MEKISVEDKKLAEEFVDVFTQKLKKIYLPGRTKREVHAKCLGFLKASFIVEENLPEDCRVGVFSAAKSFDSLIRVSSASQTSESDKRPDGRGFAIKLLGVDGVRFPEFNAEKSTQDFVLISSPAFPFNTMKEFLGASKMSIKFGKLGILFYLLSKCKFRAIVTGKKVLQHQTSLLDIQYWSMTPYKFGDKFVKYTIIPRSDYKSTMPHPRTDNYLGENMQKHLEHHEAIFDFCVQFYVDDQSTPLLDNLVVWEESASPYVKLATIKIPKQQPCTQERLLFAENMSYSPGHCLDQHAPVGPINMARLLAYDTISKFRHKRNEVERKEPTTEDFFKLK